MTAVLSAFLVSLLFVLSVYIWPSHLLRWVKGFRHPKSACQFLFPVSNFVVIFETVLTRRRDHPETIKRRFISVVSITVLSLWYLSWAYDLSIKSQLFPQEINLWHVYKTILRPLWITICFFAGHILAIAIYRQAECKKKIKTASNRFLVILRNYFIAPASEEITYRLVINQILHLSQFKPFSSSLISSSLFSLAHSHHYLLRNYTGYHVNLAIAFCQIFYTFLFALYASVIYWQSESVWGCIVLHSFCNLLEFPDFELINSDRRLFYTTIVGLIAGFGQLAIWCQKMNYWFWLIFVRFQH